MKNIALLYIVLLPAILLSVSCSKGSKDYFVENNYDVAFEVYVTDDAGQDLLDNNNSDLSFYINKDEVKVENLSPDFEDQETNGGYNETSYASWKLVLLLPPDKEHDKHRLRFHFDGKYSKSILKVTLRDDFDPYLFTGELYKKKGEGVHCEKILLDGTRVWDSQQSPPEERVIHLQLR